jgi:hypothetical protein
MKQADEIHFNLDGFDLEAYSEYLKDRQNYLDKLSRNIYDPSPSELTWFDKDRNNITNWELSQVLNNEDLLKKSTFYNQGGIKIDSEQLFK